MVKVEPRGLRFEVTPKSFTLLLRQHDGFGVMLLICLSLGLSTFELEDMVLLPLHQRIVCEQSLDLCTYKKLQIHPFLFWQTGVQSIPVEQLESSDYNADGEWEIELSDGTALVMGSGKKAQVQAQGLAQFLLGEREHFQGSDNHPWIALIQLLVWGTLVFPFYILLLDRTGKPRSTQSVYVDAQAMILKKYYFSGYLRQASIATATLKRLEVKKIKKEKQRYVFSLIAHTDTRRARLLYEAEAAVIDQHNPLNAEKKMQTLALALQGFLKEQGVEVSVS